MQDDQYHTSAGGYNPFAVFAEQTLESRRAYASSPSPREQQLNFLRGLMADNVSLERASALINERREQERKADAPPKAAAKLPPLALASNGDLLTRIIEGVRPALADTTQPTKTRIRLLWAAAKSARELGATDVVTDAFMTLAVETGLIDKRGWWTGKDVRDYVRPHGAEDVAHLISWALRGRNPFETGPLL